MIKQKQERMFVATFLFLVRTLYNASSFPFCLFVIAALMYRATG